MAYKIRRNLFLGLIMLLFIFLPLTHLSWLNLISFVIAISLFFKQVRVFFWGTPQQTGTIFKDTNVSVINSFGINWILWLVIGVIACIFIYYNIVTIDRIDPDHRFIRLALTSLALGLVGFFTSADKIKLW